MLTALMFAAALAAAPPSPVASDPPDRPIARYLERTSVAGAAGMRPQAPPGRRTDPRTNGATIGAIIGAAVIGGAVTYLCVATHEDGDPSCIGPVILWSAAGAGAGALIGAGVDALFTRSAVIRGTVRF
jgi:hypothetical protein